MYIQYIFNDVTWYYIYFLDE